MIRKATVADLEAIYQLYIKYKLNISRINDTKYAAKAQHDGFLIALEDKKDLKKRIQENFLFNVFDENGKIIGFINVNKEIYFPEEADNIIWFNKIVKEHYFHNDKSIVLHDIVVDDAYKGKGVAKQLLEDSQQAIVKAHYTHLYSIVTIAPLTNCPSIIFHTKNRFERACVTMPIDLFGLKNLQSILFYKRLHG